MTMTIAFAFLQAAFWASLGAGIGLALIWWADR